MLACFLPLQGQHCVHYFRRICWLAVVNSSFPASCLHQDPPCSPAYSLILLKLPQKCMCVNSVQGRCVRVYVCVWEGTHSYFPSSILVLCIPHSFKMSKVCQPNSPLYDWKHCRPHRSCGRPWPCATIMPLFWKGPATPPKVFTDDITMSQLFSLHTPANQRPASHFNRSWRPLTHPISKSRASNGTGEKKILIERKRISKQCETMIVVSVWHQMWLDYVHVYPFTITLVWQFVHPGPLGNVTLFNHVYF